GIVVQVAQNTRVDAELQVGSLEESLTVTGQPPLVDVLSTTTQTNIPKDMFEAIPTSRNPWVMAGLVAGVVTARLDVGGTQAMQQYALEAYGSADRQKTVSSDGLKMNWSVATGVVTTQHDMKGMVE